MRPQDPNRFEWQGIYSWREPSAGNRLEWKNDRWRWAKLALIPAVIFVVAAFSHVPFSLKSTMWLFIISGFFVTYLWAVTFFPRLIRLFENRLVISKGGGRSLSGTTIYYSDIMEMRVTQQPKNYMVWFKMRTGKNVTLFSPDKNRIDQLDELLKGFNISRS
jgi:hypothetical protein